MKFYYFRKINSSKIGKNTGSDILKIKGAIFDMDGTLIDSLMIWDILWKKMGLKYFADEHFLPNQSDRQAVRTCTLESAMKLIYENYNIGESSEDLLLFASSVINDFYSSEVQLKDGVLDFLKYAKEKNVKMCIASATAPELIKVALEHCNIKEYFLKIFSCAEFNIGKDKPYIFEKALQYLETPISETWVFEDSALPLKVVKQIGMPTVGIYDKFNDSKDVKLNSNIYISSAKDFEKLIID